MSTMNIFDLTDTWNAGATTFTAIKMNVTDTASAAGSLLIDLQVGGVSQFSVTKAGAVTAVGVAIPTISSTSTLTNKTLSSPTFSGTISGPVSVAGVGTTDQSGNLRLRALRTAGQTNGVYIQGLTTADAMIFSPAGSDDVAIGFDAGVGATASTLVRFYQAGGTVFGAATGGAKGAGTINCTGAYDDNVLLTDLVLDYAVTGAFDAVKYVNHPLRDQVASWWFDPDQYAKFWKTERRLPGMLTWDDPADKPSTGESITRLTAVVEMQAALIENMNQRIKELER